MELIQAELKDYDVINALFPFSVERYYQLFDDCYKFVVKGESCGFVRVAENEIIHLFVLKDESVTEQAVGLLLDKFNRLRFTIHSNFGNRICNFFNYINNEFVLTRRKADLSCTVSKDTVTFSEKDKVIGNFSLDGSVVTEIKLDEDYLLYFTNLFQLYFTQSKLKFVSFDLATVKNVNLVNRIKIDCAYIKERWTLTRNSRTSTKRFIYSHIKTNSPLVVKVLEGMDGYFFTRLTLSEEIKNYDFYILDTRSVKAESVSGNLSDCLYYANECSLQVTHYDCHSALVDRLQETLAFTDNVQLNLNELSPAFDTLLAENDIVFDGDIIVDKQFQAAPQMYCLGNVKYSSRFPQINIRNFDTCEVIEHIGKSILCSIDGTLLSDHTFTKPKRLRVKLGEYHYVRLKGQPILPTDRHFTITTDKSSFISIDIVNDFIHSIEYFGTYDLELERLIGLHQSYLDLIGRYNDNLLEDAGAFLQERWAQWILCDEFEEMRLMLVNMDLKDMNQRKQAEKVVMDLVLSVCTYEESAVLQKA